MYMYVFFNSDSEVVSLPDILSYDVASGSDLKPRFKIDS